MSSTYHVQNFHKFVLGSHWTATQTVHQIYLDNADNASMSKSTQSTREKCISYAKKKIKIKILNHFVYSDFLCKCTGLNFLILCEPLSKPSRLHNAWCGHLDPWPRSVHDYIIFILFFYFFRENLESQEYLGSLELEELE